MTQLHRRTVLTAAGATTLGATALGGGAWAAGPAAAHPRRAAMVIHHGRVFVGDGRHRPATAVAVGTDGRILAVGGDRDLRRFVGRGTRVVDAGGGTVMAGIHDGHVHPMYAGLRSLNPSLDDAPMTVEDLQAALTLFLAQSSAQEPDGWLVVESWNPAGILPPGTVADKAYLDVLDTTRPVALRGSDGHNTWVNSRALALAGVDSSTPDPSGGEVVRYPGGTEPTGLLKDSAQDLVTAVIPEPTEEQQLAAFAWAFEQMAAGGITSALDAWVDPWQLDAYATLADRGQLPQRITPALLLSPEQILDPAGSLAWAKELAASYAGVPGLRFGSVKVFMDGVIEFPAQTAALLEPYLSDDGTPTDQFGELYVDGPTLGALTRAFDRAGWQMHAHAIGDAAVRAALDGYQIGTSGHRRRGRNRHTVGHLQLVHPDDYGRFAELGVIADMQLQWATRNIWTMESLAPYIGPERHARMYPANSLRMAGALLAGGSDWPVDPLYPWNQVQSAIDRMGLYGEGEPLHPEQGIPRVHSLRMHTAGTAFQLRQESMTGTVEAGKQADLVVLDRDVTTCPVSEIKDAVPLLTLVGGASVFDAGTDAGRRTLRRVEAAASAAALAGRTGHGDLAAGRHQGCPCSPGRSRAPF